MIIIFIEGPCPKRLNIFKISALRTPYSNIIDILSELRASGIYFPQSALSTYSTIYTKLPRIASLFRSIDADSKVYFLTPLGLLSENDPAIWYEECFADIPPDRLRKILQKFGGLDKIYDILEERFDLAIFCLSTRLLKVVELEYFVPTDKPCIVVSDAYSSTKHNIYSITPNHFLVSRLRKTYGKVTITDIYQYSLEYIAKSLSIIKDELGNIKSLFRQPETLFQKIFSQKILNTIFAPSKKQNKLVKFIR